MLCTGSIRGGPAAVRSILQKMKWPQPTCENSRCFTGSQTAPPAVTLRDGTMMPVAVMGTYVGNATGHTSPEDAPELVAAALEVGYKHFDTGLMVRHYTAGRAVCISRLGIL